MIYVAGIIGFIGGFSLALGLIGYLLKDRPRTDLLEDKGLRLTYGLLAWALAGISSYSMIWLYKYYFTIPG